MELKVGGEGASSVDDCVGPIASDQKVLLWFVQPFISLHALAVVHLLTYSLAQGSSVVVEPHELLFQWFSVFSKLHSLRLHHIW